MRYLFGSCLLDTQRYELYREHVRVPLRSTVLDILAYLITYRDRLVCRDELLAHVWPDQPPSMHPTVLDACLLEARRAIGDSGQAQQMIRNLHGQGYRFIAPVQALPAPGPEPGQDRDGGGCHARAMATVQALWQQVIQGRGQVVGITSAARCDTAGVVWAVQHCLPRRPDPAVHRYCCPAEPTTPYGLVANVFGQTCGLTATDPLNVINAKFVQRCAEAGLVLTDQMALGLHLLRRPDIGACATDRLQALQAEIFVTLLRLYHHHSRQQPLVLVVEHLQWLDPSSAAWLTLLVQQLATIPLLVLVTYDPGYHVPWMDRSYAHQIVL